MYLKILNGKIISAAKLSRLFTELCTAPPISINASIGIPKAFPYAGSKTNAEELVENQNGNMRTGLVTAGSITVSARKG